VAAEGLPRLDLARPSVAEPLDRAPLGLQLRHSFRPHLEKGSGLVPEAASEINPSAGETMPWAPRPRAELAPAPPAQLPRNGPPRSRTSPDGERPAAAGPAAGALRGAGRRAGPGAPPAPPAPAAAGAAAAGSAGSAPGS